MNNFNNNKGVVLLLTFIFMISLTVIATSYLYMVAQSVKNTKDQSENMMAIYLAEAGLNKAVWYLTNTAPDETSNGSWRTDDTYSYPEEPSSYPGSTRDPQQESLGDGTYTMWVEDFGSDIQVTARGTVKGIQRIIREIITLSFSAPQAFNYAQYSDGSIDFNSSSGTVTGDIAATGTVDNESGMTITGTITESSSVVAPTVSSSSYAAIADTTYSGNHTYTAGTYTGIHYVDGRATINDGVTFLGTIVATGNIVLTNTDNFVSTPTSNYPALVSDATITGSRMGTAVISGLVFGASSVSIPRGSSNTINGSIISGGDINLTRGSSWTITYDSDLASDPPPYFTEGSGAASGDNWEEL